jgi:hypothetical protein
MTVKVIKPTWERTAAGSGLRIARDGTLLLEFAPARGEREYDWENKETFGLSAVECADVLEAAATGAEKSFFHDPNKGGAGEGAVAKTLRLAPAREGGFFWSLSVSARAAGSQARLDTSVSAGEMRVIREVMAFAIPRLLGFDEQFAGAPEVRDAGAGGGGGGGGERGGGAPVGEGPPF